MRRDYIQPRPRWQAEVESAGLVFHTLDSGKPYWDESACYVFTADEIEQLESATNDLHQLCLQAVDYAITHNRFADFGIGDSVARAIAQEWDREPPTLYGRFDFGFDGVNPPKLFEYNADTPTSLLEAAVIQWQWLEQTDPAADQFNSIWENLIEQWRWLAANGKLKSQTIHFAAQDHWEDLMTVAVLRDTAEQAGLSAKSLLMEEIGWNDAAQQFRDLEDLPIGTIFKLYPWEFMLQDQFGINALANLDQTQWIEPVWKMLLSNKALLALLWEVNPGHPNLLPAYLGSPRDLEEYVAKPILGREGANVEVVTRSHRTTTLGPYSLRQKVYQGFYDQKVFSGNRPVIGSWVVGETACGISIRETTDLVTDNLARFVPHKIESL